MRALLSSAPGRFVRHFLEMVVAMFAGMIVLGPLVPHTESIELGTLAMATTMTIGMAGWMAYRRHSTRSIVEMSAAMYLSFVALYPAYWAGLIDGAAVMILGHVIMLPAMAGAMLLRRDDDTGAHAGHHDRSVGRP